MNTTNSAVRIVHLESGIAAVAQSRRCQHQNREEAIKTLRRNLALQIHSQTPETAWPQPNTTTTADAAKSGGNEGEANDVEVQEEQTTSRVLTADETAIVSRLFGKNVSKKDPRYYEGMKLLLRQLRRHAGALKCVLFYCGQCCDHV